MSEIDPQDPLPEPSWTFRRWFTWLLTAACLIFIGCIIWRITESRHLAGVAYGLIGLCALIATYYLIAPSAEHLAKLARLADLFKRR